MSRLAVKDRYHPKGREDALALLACLPPVMRQIVEQQIADHDYQRVGDVCEDYGFPRRIARAFMLLARED